MRRALSVVACLAGLVWGGMIGWAVNRPETLARTRIRTAAFVTLIGASALSTSARRTKTSDTQDEEETL